MILQKTIIAGGFAATDRVSQMQGMDAGVYLKKPYTRQQLADAVKQQMHLPELPMRKALLVSANAAVGGKQILLDIAIEKTTFPADSSLF